MFRAAILSGRRFLRLMVRASCRVCIASVVAVTSAGVSREAFLWMNFSVVSSNCSPLCLRLQQGTDLDIGLHSSSESHYFIRIQLVVYLLAKKILNRLFYKQHKGGVADHCHLIHFITVQLCILQGPLTAANGLVHKGVEQLFKYGPTEHYLLAADKSDEIVIGKEAPLGFFCLQMQGLRPCFVVLELLLRKAQSLHPVSDNRFVKINIDRVGISIGNQNLKNTIVGIEEGNIKGASSQVLYCNGLFFRFVQPQAICQASRPGLVDNA